MAGVKFDVMLRTKDKLRTRDDTGGGGLPPLTSLDINNTIYVDAQFGNDGTGVREDMSKPFLTIGGAYGIAVAGDLIHVRPGAYTSQISLGLDVSYFFDRGATVTFNGTVIQTSGVTNSQILGYGVFTNTNAGSNIMELIDSGSNIVIECDDIQQPTGASTGMLIRCNTNIECNNINVVNTNIYNLGALIRVYIDCPRINTIINTNAGLNTGTTTEIFVRGNLLRANIDATGTPARTVLFEHNGGVLGSFTGQGASGQIATSYLNGLIRPAYRGLNPATAINTLPNSFTYTSADVDAVGTGAIGISQNGGTYKGVGDVLAGAIALASSVGTILHTGDIRSTGNVGVYYINLGASIDATTTGNITGASHALQYDFNNIKAVHNGGKISSPIDAVKNNANGANNDITINDCVIETTGAGFNAPIYVGSGFIRTNNCKIISTGAIIPYVVQDGGVPVLNGCSIISNNGGVADSLLCIPPSANALFYGTSVSNKPYNAGVVPQVNLANGFIVSALVV